MPVEEERPPEAVAAKIAAVGWEAVFDHISDHRPVRSTWKRWRQEVRKAGDIGAESMGKGRKESEKVFLRPLGPGCREFESRHSDQAGPGANALRAFSFVLAFRPVTGQIL